MCKCSFGRHRCLHPIRASRCQPLPQAGVLLPCHSHGCRAGGSPEPRRCLASAPDACQLALRCAEVLTETW